MFVCALDVRPASLRVVLTVNDSVPLFLEGRWFRRPVDPARVLTLLQEWENFYRDLPDVLVGCRQDPWPVGLEEALRRGGYRLHWVDHKDVEKVVMAWKSRNQDSRWLRGGLMGFLMSTPGKYLHPGNVSERVAMEWIYAALRARVVELEGEIFGEGRSLCPGHLSLECPDCEPIPEEFPGD